MMQQQLHSAIYEGTVRHRRFSPKAHAFSYKVFMVYLDLNETRDVFSQSLWWSHKRLSLAWFRRQDFFDGGPSTPLYQVVADKVEIETGARPKGPIRMLCNLRYFGFIINPITCYYCFDESGENLQTIVAEVTNTPWKKRCHYVLNFTSQDDSLCDKTSSRKQNIQFDKSMHVSPFQPMNMVYEWKSKQPGEDLLIHMNVFTMAEGAVVAEEKSPVFDATLVLQREAITGKKMNSVLWSYPWMTAKVCLGIYWQALKLWLKKAPFYSYPDEHPSVPIIKNKRTISAGDK